MGFDVNLFLQPLSPSLLCPICRQVLEDPVQSIKCEHVFCELCALGRRIQLTDNETILLSTLDHSNVGLQIKCPVDHLPLSSDLLQPVQNESLLQRLDSLQMRCSHLGCPQIDSLLHIRLHRSTCEFALTIVPTQSVQRFHGQSHRNGQELNDLRYALQRLAQTFERDAHHEQQIHNRLIRCESDLQHLNERLKQLRESMVKLVAPEESQMVRPQPLSNSQRMNLSSLSSSPSSSILRHSDPISVDRHNRLRNSHFAFTSSLTPSSYETIHFPSSPSQTMSESDFNSLWMNWMENDFDTTIPIATTTTTTTSRTDVSSYEEEQDLQTCVAFIRNLNEFLDENILREYLRQNEICVLSCDRQVTIYERSRDFRILFLKRDFHRLFDERLWPAGTSINLVPSFDHHRQSVINKEDHQNVIVVHGNRVQDLPGLFIRPGLTF